jgi:hypothetical protein
MFIYVCSVKSDVEGSDGPVYATYLELSPLAFLFPSYKPRLGC